MEWDWCGARRTQLSVRARLLPYFPCSGRDVEESFDVTLVF